MNARAKNPTFSRSAIVLLAASAAALFALTILLQATGSGLPFDKSAEFDKSAVGYAGFYDVLRRLGRPVVRPLQGMRASVDARGTFVLWANDPYGERVNLPNAPRILFILPKWRGIRDEKKPQWLSGMKLLPLRDVRRVLALLPAGGGSVSRGKWPEGQIPRHGLPDPIWKINVTDFAPVGSGPLQLVRSEKMRPIVAGEEGMLIGEISDENRKIWVLSDPDVLSNHGILKGDNAAFAISVVDELRFWNNDDPGAPVAFGGFSGRFQRTAVSPIMLLFRFPFGIVTLLTGCSAVLLVLAGMRRFGVPQVPRPALDFGRATLIANGARLLDYAGHHAVVLRRYVKMTVHSVAQALHAPYGQALPGCEERGLAAWLDRVGEARGVQRSCRDIMDIASRCGGEGDLDRLFESAKEIRLWKRDILKGEVTDESATYRRYRQER
jgi:hypothetical protein